MRQDLHASSQAQAGDSGDPTELAVKSWLKRIALLKQRLGKTPEANTPELRFLKALDWVEVAANTTLKTDADYRKALAELRKRGGGYFVEQLHAALGKYMQANNGQWPTDVSQLEPYFAPPVERALWERWEIVSHTAFPGREFAGEWVLTEKATVDPEFDSRHTIDGPASAGVGPYRPYGHEEEPSGEVAEHLALKATLEPVLKAYRLANGGKEPGDPFQLQPYIANPTQQAALERIIEIINKHK